MTVELRPLGVNCNINCLYCYQNPQRDAGNRTKTYDLNLMKAAIIKAGGPFTLFGGEALLLPENDLEELWRWGYEKYGRNSIQTNGTLINEHHLAMFKDYNVHVGISMDGPEELNDVRWSGTLKQTRTNTHKTQWAIEHLCKLGRPPSLITTLHSGNATIDKLPEMDAWFHCLEQNGVISVRLHILEVDQKEVGLQYALTTEENITAFLHFYKLQKSLNCMRFDLFDDMRNMLLGQDRRTTCVWNACDPYTTHAVQGVEGNGNLSNCGRTNKDGVDYLKADSEGFERYVALYYTPREFCGCKGCRFFLMCKGQCPGTAINGDWRNRSAYCEVWLALYHRIEEDLMSDGQLPISANVDLRADLESEFIASWKGGRNTTMSTLIELRNQTKSSVSCDEIEPHLDSPHRDSPHVDSFNTRIKGKRSMIHDDGPFPPHDDGPFPPHDDGPFPPHDDGPFPPHGDGPFPPHDDVHHHDLSTDPHLDSPHEDAPHDDSGPHEDVPHDDFPHHDDPHEDHGDYSDHNDSTPHQDQSHNDIPHDDNPAHQDNSHSDIAHDDIPHEDNGPHNDSPHSDFSHSDVGDTFPHFDSPIDDPTGRVGYPIDRLANRITGAILILSATILLSATGVGTQPYSQIGAALTIVVAIAGVVTIIRSLK